MLLKASNGDKTTYVANNNGKGKRSISARIHRKTFRVATKPGVSGKRVGIGKRISSLGKNQKNFNASFPPTTSSSLCDNSNDSGLGWDATHESQHIIQHQSSNTNNMALTTATNNNNNNNCNGNSVNYQRSIRYGDIAAQANYGTTTSFVRHEISSTKNSNNHNNNNNKHCIQFGAGKKIKSAIKKPFMPVKHSTTNHMTLKNETEDTCDDDDFFSTHVQKNNLTNTVSSPTSLNYSSNSPSEKTSTSSSPVLTSNRSSPEITNGTTENNNLAPESAAETLDEVHSSTLSSLQNQNYSAVSRDGSVQLQIVTQPEQQHRARYQTEGSRGAVKDKSGNGFPVVKINGYNKPAILQVFIGNDVGKVSPHIFYQACKVSGKNSTPCNEVKVDGTMVIEIEIKPDNDMTVICDCVGILKERNVDVEHRLGKNNTLAATVTRNKKKSTKCRMIFRAKINEDTDCPEILLICSNTITCTQPPGVPEICKKSLDSCSSMGGKELFIIGKNFLKDTKITFVRFDESRQAKKIWEETVLPDKEYLQQTHLICTVPAYPEEITEPVQVQIYVTSSNKKSEPHSFVYMPLKKHYCCSIPQPSIDALTNIAFSSTNQQDLSSPTTNGPTNSTQIQNVLSLTWNDTQVTSPTVENIMPPPLTPGVTPRKPSFSKTLSDPGTNDTKINITTDLQETTTSSPTIQPQQASTVSVKEMIYNDNPLLDVTGQCFMNPTASLISPNPAVGLLDEFQVVQHIKTEQNSEQQLQQQNNVTSNVTQAPQGTEFNSVQQQQVENFINMICAQVEPAIVQQNADNMINHHLNQELIINPTPVVQATNNNTMNGVLQTDHAGNMMSAISTQPVMCEQNILSVQLDGTNIIPIHNTLDTSISNDQASNTSLISNAVSEATAETQAVVKQMIASVAAEILSENPNETQSSINNFISSTLGPEMGQVAAEQSAAQQTQIANSQQQQLQEIIAQELLTPVMIKKEVDDEQPQNVQDALISDPASTNPSTSTMTQPFSPTPADFNLTTMSESDLISFINPSVFI